MKPRLLHVITRLCVGGAQLTLFESAKDLASDYEMVVAYGPDVGNEGSIEDRVREAFPTYLLPSLRRAIIPREDFHAIRVMRALYEELEPDIVHTHSSKAGIVGRAASGATAARIVHSVHGWGHTPLDSAAKRRLLVTAERAVASRADILIAVSSDVRDEGLALGIGRPEQYRVVPEYVDYRSVSDDHTRARECARAELGLPADAPVVGWVGRFMPQKDPEALGAAVAEALILAPEAWAAFVGDGPYREQVQRRLAAAGVDDRVRFAGFQPDVRRLYAAFDVLLHTSLYEGQPRVVQEAIAERIPVVTARVAGTRELLASREVGTEVAAGASEAMADEVVRRLAEPGLRAPLSPAAIAGVAATNGRRASKRLHREVYAELRERALRANRTRVQH